MMNFKIGDAVRLKSDGTDDLMLIIRGVNGAWAYCESKCLNRRQWEKLGDMELVRPDPQADLIQAIREVLLSDEFMKAFAAAFRSEVVSEYTFSDEVRSLEHPIPGVNQPMRKDLATEVTNDPT